MAVFVVPVSFRQNHIPNFLFLFGCSPQTASEVPILHGRCFDVLRFLENTS
jgi:hypothetical protein